MSLLAFALAGWSTSQRWQAAIARDVAIEARLQTELERQAAEKARVRAEELQKKAAVAKQALERANHELHSRELAGVSLQQLQPNPSLALKIALHAEKEFHTFQSENALRQAVNAIQMPNAIFGGHERTVRNAQFSPNGEYIVTSGDENIARVWNVSTRQISFTLVGHTNVINSARFSADGKQIVTSSTDKTVKVWALDGREKLSSKTLAAVRTISLTDSVNDARFSSNGRLIVTGDDGGTVQILSIRNNRERAERLGEGQGSVLSVQFSRDDRWAVSAGADGIARLWHQSQVKEINDLSRVAAASF